MELGNQIKSLRLSKGLTQEALAEQLGVTAQARELAGDAPGAIAALEEEIILLADEWNTTTGETVDKVRREMDRLKRKL